MFAHLRRRNGSALGAVLPLFLLLLLLLWSPSPAASQQLSVPPLPQLGEGLVCSIRPVVSSDGSWATSQCFFAAGSGLNQTLTLQPFVYVTKDGCLITEAGMATCVQEEFTQTFPTPVVDAISPTAYSPCYLFPNNTIGCAAVGSHWANEALLFGSTVLRGFVPVPLALVNASTGVGVAQVASSYFSADYPAQFVCLLLTNSTVTCVLATSDGLLSDAIVRDAPVPDGRVPLLLRAGVSHACLLYTTGEVACWGDSIGGSLSPPLGVLFSSIDCGDRFSCGIRMDGSLSCWGSSLTSTAIAASAGQFGQVVLSGRMPAAISALDGSLTTWGTFDPPMVVPSVAAKAPNWPCVLRADIDYASTSATPAIACWTDEGFAAGSLYLPPELQRGVSFRSLVVYLFFVCVVFESNGSTRCFGDPTLEVDGWGLPRAFEHQEGVRHIGLITTTLWAHLEDGRILTPNHVLPYMLPDAVNNNTAYRFEQVDISTTGAAVCGILVPELNGTATCVFQPPAPICPGLMQPHEALAFLQAEEDPSSGSGGPPLAFLGLSVSSTFPQSPATCNQVRIGGWLNDGRAVVWGSMDSNGVPPANNNNNNDTHRPLVPTVATLPPPPFAPAGVVNNYTQLVIQVFWVDRLVACAVGSGDAVACFHLTFTIDSELAMGTGTGGRQQNWTITPLDAPLEPLSRIGFFDLFYGVSSRDRSLVRWDPFASSDGGDSTTGLDPLPSMVARVAPQFFYRFRAGPTRPCPPGTFSIGVGAITPMCSGRCAAGSYGLGNDTSVACAGLCPPGHFCPSESAAPTRCPPGSFGREYGLVDPGCSGSCLPGYECPAGSIDPTLRPCAVGFASRLPDQPCRPCDVNSYSGLNASAACNLCSPGSFAPAQGMASCLRCPDQGMDCSLGSAQIQRGYWALLRANFSSSASASSSSSNDLDHLGPYQCPPGYCDGSALDGPSQVSNASLSSSTTASGLMNPCSVHRSLSSDNPLCGRCDLGYWEWNSVCTECPSVNWGLLWVLVLAAFVFVGLLHRLSQPSAGSSARVSVLIFFAQSALLMLRSHSTDELAKIFSWLHVFNLGFTQPTGAHCLAQLTAQQRLWFEALIPVGALLPLAVIAAGSYCWTHARSSSPAAAPLRFSVHPYVRTSIAILLIAFQQMCISTLAFLQCVSVGPNYSVVFSSPAIDCRSAQYRAAMPFAILLLLTLTIIAPAILARFLFRNRDIIRGQQILAAAGVAAKDDENGDVGTWLPLAGEADEEKDQQRNASLQLQKPALGVASSDASLFHQRYSSLYALFRPACFLWLPLLLLRRVALIACAVLLLQSPAYQSLLFSCLCFGNLACHIHVHPYASTVDNRLETMSLAALLLLAQVLASQSQLASQSSSAASSSAGGNMPLLIQMLAATLLFVPLLVLMTACASKLLQHPLLRAAMQRFSRTAVGARCCWIFDADCRPHRGHATSTAPSLAFPPLLTADSSSSSYAFVSPPSSALSSSPRELGPLSHNGQGRAVNETIAR